MFISLHRKSGRTEKNKVTKQGTGGAEGGAEGGDQLPRFSLLCRFFKKNKEQKRGYYYIIGDTSYIIIINPINSPIYLYLYIFFLALR